MGGGGGIATTPVNAVIDSCYVHTCAAPARWKRCIDQQRAAEGFRANVARQR